MKRLSLLLSVLFFVVVLSAFASASLQIANLPFEISTVHGTTISIPFTVLNSGGNVTDVSLKISSLTDQNNFINVPIVNESKRSIEAGKNESYTISNYAIALYSSPGLYPVALNVSAFENISGTLTQISAIETFNVRVNETLSLDMPSLTINGYPKRNTTSSFVITNTGNVNLTDITFTATPMKDSENNTITVSFPEVVIITPGQSGSISFSIVVPEEQEIKSYTSAVTVRARAGSREFVKNVSMTVNVNFGYCKYGQVGTLSLEIREPDSGDDFTPSSKVDVEVKINNNDDEDHDYTIVADIFDMTDGKFIDVEEETDKSVDEDSYEYATLQLEVPSDIDEDHEYRIYVKAYDDEEEQCREDYVSIDIERKTHDIAIGKITMDGEVKCDSSASLEFEISNAGKRDEDVKITVFNNELGINEEKTLDLETEEERKVSFSLQIPKNALEKEYTLSIRAAYDLSDDEYRTSTSAVQKFKVKGNCLSRAASITAEVVSEPVEGEQFKVKVEIFNTGEINTTYDIAVNGYDSWAKLDKVEPSKLTLGKGESGNVFVYLTPLKGEVGEKTFKVKALYTGGVIEKDVSVEIKEKVTAQTYFQRLAKKLSSISGFDLATVNIILIVAIILIVLWITRVRRS